MSLFLVCLKNMPALAKFCSAMFSVEARCLEGQTVVARMCSKFRDSTKFVFLDKLSVRPFLSSGEAAAGT